MLRYRREKVNRSKFAFDELQPVTIHFDGSISKRHVEPGRAYTMDLFHARGGDLVVAKIDLKNGAVAVVPSDWSNVVTTGHFAAFEPDRRRLEPEYLRRIIQAPFFKDHLWRNKVGAEGRKEVKLDFFLSLPIPLPPVATQRAIVAYSRDARAACDEAHAAADRLLRDAQAAFLASLGLGLPDETHRPKVMVARWQQVERWGVAYNQAVRGGLDLHASRFEVETLGELLTAMQYGTSTKANTNGQGVPVLRMPNIKDGVIDFTDLKHVVLRKSEESSLLLGDGDILINRTNSKELVGKCAVFHDTGRYVFASYLIRLQADAKKANPDYLAAVINGPLGRQQIDALSRQAIGQANINSQEIRSLMVPLPPLDVQQELVRLLSDARTRADAIRADAQQRHDQAMQEVDAMILGTMPVPKA
ncbi:MAG: restriction endonuclease subunit S [Alphaproteobacteria bacterium]|nr:restriction endonuclease subunit S [Alphaproteobacteria bacterium]